MTMLHTCHHTFYRLTHSQIHERLQNEIICPKQPEKRRDSHISILKLSVTFFYTTTYSHIPNFLYYNHQSHSYTTTTSLSPILQPPVTIPYISVSNLIHIPLPVIFLIFYTTTTSHNPLYFSFQSHSHTTTSSHIPILKPPVTFPYTPTSSHIPNFLYYNHQSHSYTTTISHIPYTTTSSHIPTLQQPVTFPYISVSNLIHIPLPVTFLYYNFH